VTVALATADRLIRMVNDLLDSAKIEAGKLKLQRRTLTVSQLGALAIDNVRLIDAAARIKLSIDVQPGVRVVHVDVDPMVQAIVNLLSNAIKFARPDPLSRSVRVPWRMAASLRRSMTPAKASRPRGSTSCFRSSRNSRAEPRTRGEAPDWAFGSRKRSSKSTAAPSRSSAAGKAERRSRSG